jgi:hypothetical protein
MAQWTDPAEEKKYDPTNFFSLNQNVKPAP